MTKPNTLNKKSTKHSLKNMHSPLTFIDLFAGCGGFSLGFLNAGLVGLFAIEKNPLAFETLAHNLINGDKQSYQWPEWLKKAPMSCEDFIIGYKNHLHILSGSVDIIIGGPPCQGFSTAGRRDPTDPRNSLTDQYLQIVEFIKPKAIVIENVTGISFTFDAILPPNESRVDLSKISYSQFISEALAENGYLVSSSTIDTSMFGVPQNRHRYIIFAIRSDLVKTESIDIKKRLESIRDSFLTSKGLPILKRVSAKQAISDLETHGKELIDNTDFQAKGFKEIKYNERRRLSNFQKLMRVNYSLPPNSLRLPNHKPKTIEKFIRIQRICKAGHALSTKKREELSIRKHTISVLDAKKPSPTITTLPDDILHYSEPRILTARETARLQTFPDWFEFKGKYTTGGKFRKNETPRYTQIGNAVPPLFAEALAHALISIFSEISSEFKAVPPREAI